MAFNFSRIVGPLLFAYYFARRGLPGYRLGFLAAGVPALAAAPLVYAALRRVGGAGGGGRLSVLLRLPARWLTPYYLYAVMSRAGTAAWISLMGAVFLGLGLPQEAPGLYMASTAAAWLLLGYFTGALVDRLGVRRAMFLSEAGFMASLSLVAALLRPSSWLPVVIAVAVADAFAFSGFVAAVNKLLMYTRNVGVEAGRLNMATSVASVATVYAAGVLYGHSPLLVPVLALALHASAAAALGAAGRGAARELAVELLQGHS